VTAPDDIRALLQRYARFVDDRDIEGLASLFHPDARIAGARAEQSLEEWLQTMRAPRSFPSSMHFLGEPLVVEDGAGRADVDTYAVVYQLGDQAAGQGDLTLGMRYRDQVALDQGRWLFTQRASTVVWMR
jgi:SnoaL-like domain